MLGLATGLLITERRTREPRTSSPSSGVEQAADAVQAVDAGVDRHRQRGGAAEHWIAVRHPYPRVGERLIGVEHLQALVDAENQRQPGQRVIGQRAVVACLVLVIRRGGGPPEQRALVVY